MVKIECKEEAKGTEYLIQREVCEVSLGQRSETIFWKLPCGG
jgi:hypothetical protein